MARDYARINQELEQLAQNFKAQADVPRASILGNDGRRAVWSIELEDGRQAFMSARRYPHMNDSTFVVEVDADRFYYHWLRSSAQTGGHCKLREDMPADYKYAQAEDGFSSGVENPVPLAEVNAWTAEDGTDHIGFSNGITRSFWLLSKGAKSFPVETNHPESAQKLHELAGIGNGPVSFEEFFDVPAHE